MVFSEFMTAHLAWFIKTDSTAYCLTPLTLLFIKLLFNTEFIYTTEFNSLARCNVGMEEKHEEQVYLLVTGKKSHSPLVNFLTGRLFCCPE